MKHFHSLTSVAAVSVMAAALIVGCSSQATENTSASSAAASSSAAAEAESSSEASAANTESSAESAESSAEASGESAAAEELGEFKAIEVNGVELHYQHAGEGKPIIMVHGNGGSHKVFDVAVGQLVDAGYSVYALDSRGQGANAPLEEYHYKDMAEDVYQFMQALKLEKPAYYGWSDGGIIGLELLIAHPDCVSLMIGSGTNIRPDGAVPEVMDQIKADYEKTKNPLEELMITEPNITKEELQTINVPVLLTVGENDAILPEHTEEIAADLPNCEVKTLPGEDHSSYIEHSDKIAPIIIDFLKQNNY